MSGMMTWSDEYSVHLGEIDEQHQKIVELINMVHDELVKPTGKLKEVLRNLVDYTVHHFRLEEEMMLRAKSPDSEAHKQLHNVPIDQVRRFRDRTEGGEKGVGMELLHFLQKWLITHICQEDKAYIPYVDKHINKSSWWSLLWGK